MGWRTWKPIDGSKGPGSRLLPLGKDPGHSVQVREGLTGWKAGMKFIRLWNEDKRHYTIIALSENDSIMAMATGKKDAETWGNIYAALRNKGIEVDE